MEPKVKVTRRRGGKTTATITFKGQVSFDPSNAEEVHAVFDQIFRILHQFHTPEEVRRIGENMMAQLGACRDEVAQEQR